MLTERGTKTHHFHDMFTNLIYTCVSDYRMAMQVDGWGIEIEITFKVGYKTYIYTRDLSFYEKHLIPVLFLKLQKQYITHNRQTTKTTY